MNATPHDPMRLSSQAREALEETLAAYELGALPDAEAADVARHLAVCALCRGLTADFQITVGQLAAAPEPVAPSAELKQRLLIAAQAEQQNGAQPAAPAAPLPFPGPRPDAERPRPVRGGAAWFPWGVAAAALALSLSMGVWNAQLRGEARELQELVQVYESARETYALAGTTDAPRARGVVAVPAAGGAPVVVLQDLPQQPPGRTYQVWVIRNGQPVSAAVLRPGSEGQQKVELQAPLAGAQTVAVSVEPAGGSPSPTGPIVLAGNL